MNFFLGARRERVDMERIHQADMERFRFVDAPNDFQEDWDRPAIMNIYQAAHLGELERIRVLVEREGVDVNAHSDFPLTPLQIASGAGHISIVRFLLANGADAAVVNYAGQTPLHAACWSQRMAVAQFLLVNGAADVNARDYWDRTPLHFAAENCRLSFVRYLLARGAASDILVRDRSGKTPLDWASSTNYHEEVFHYLESTAEVHKRHSLILYLVQTGHFGEKFNNTAEGTNTAEEMKTTSGACFIL